MSFKSRNLVKISISEEFSKFIAFFNIIVLLIGLLGFLTERPEFLDIALLYALVNFVGTIAILKFFRYRNLGLSSDEIASREDT